MQSRGFRFLTLFVVLVCLIGGIWATYPMYRLNLNCIYNVQVYGAKGDGAADDTKAIQAAWNDASDPNTYALGHNTLYFPSGTYKHGALNFSGRGNVTVKGGGQFNTTLLCINPVLKQPNDPCIDFSGDQSLTLEDMQIINGAGADATNGSRVAVLFGLVADGSGSILKVRNMAFQGNPSAGQTVVIYGLQAVDFTNTYITSFGHDSAPLTISVANAGGGGPFTSSDQTLASPPVLASGISFTNTVVGNWGATGGADVYFDNGGTSPADNNSGIRNIVFTNATLNLNNTGNTSTVYGAIGSSGPASMSGVAMHNIRAYMDNSTGPVFKFNGPVNDFNLTDIGYSYNTPSANTNIQFNGGFFRSHIDVSSRLNPSTPTVAFFGNNATSSTMQLPIGDAIEGNSGGELLDNSLVTLSNCGTNPTLFDGASAKAGELVAGAGATSCTLNFSTPVGRHSVICAGGDDGQPLMWWVSNKGINGVTFTCFNPVGAANCTAGNWLNWKCQGY